MTVRVYFAINLAIAVLWPILIQGNRLVDFLVGFGLGALLLSLAEPDYGRRGRSLVSFVAYLIEQIVVSSLRVARLILRRRLSNDMAPRSALIAVPLQIRQPLEITLLASSITLTPGTISVDLARDEHGAPVLLVHALDLSDGDASTAAAELAAEIKQGFEERILAITHTGNQTERHG